MKEMWTDISTEVLSLSIIIAEIIDSQPTTHYWK